MGDDQLGVLVGQLAILGIASQGFLEFGHLFRRHIAGNVAAIFVTLVVVIGALGALAQDADGAAFHAGDLGDELDQRVGRRFGVHEREVYVIHIYFANKKRAENPVFKKFVSHPFRCTGAGRYST